jgi:hypothetical protein
MVLRCLSHDSGSGLAEVLAAFLWVLSTIVGIEVGLNVSWDWVVGFREARERFSPIHIPCIAIQ